MLLSLLLVLERQGDAVRVVGHPVDVVEVVAPDAHGLEAVRAVQPPEERLGCAGPRDLQAMERVAPEREDLGGAGEVRVLLEQYTV